MFPDERWYPSLRSKETRWRSGSLRGTGNARECDGTLQGTMAVRIANRGPGIPSCVFVLCAKEMHNLCIHAV
jgi:hypothetical protein